MSCEGEISGCEDDEFTCECHNKKDKLGCGAKECIPKEWHRDGKIHCSDFSDESPAYYRKERCGECVMELFRLDNVSVCSNLNTCVPSTCFKTPSLMCTDLGNCTETEVLCTSYCPKSEQNKCHPVYQCNDGTLILGYQFCNVRFDCPLKTIDDELKRFPGFKCAQSRTSCLLPSRNLYDDVAHCPDQSDLCFKNATCFQCLHEKLYIPSKQVCDGVFDCSDFSDECLCNSYINLPVCHELYKVYGISTSFCSMLTSVRSDDIRNILEVPPVNNKGNASISINPLFSVRPDRTTFNVASFLENSPSEVKLCLTRNNYIIPVYCDGYPDCRDFSDECDCENPPSYCSDNCYSFYPLGDRYCDGMIDEAWKFINDSSCPKGFDEKFCPNRFYCEAGDYISIDKSQVCDLEKDCRDGSDEEGCSSALFSSDTEMIANPVLRSAFWIIGIAVLIGNLLVIATTIKMLKTKKLSDSLCCQHTIILNISFADLIMGIYLLIIATFSAVYSGFYGGTDKMWRSSVECSIFGSLAIISSEASCFLMVTLTAFRLRNISNPIASVTMSTRPWKFCIAASWLVSLALAITPIVAQNTTDYFMYQVLFRSSFNKIGFWKLSTLNEFVCNYVALTNLTVSHPISSWNWKITKSFLEEIFPNAEAFKEYGYYGETSICMPRLYVKRGDGAWEYTFSIMTVNFVAFIFIVVSYVAIYIHSTKKAKALGNSSKQSSKQESVMQTKIARIIATDFCCWIPISIMSYLRIGGVEFSSVVYQISAVFLLPINSLLNPFLYSSLP